MDSKTIVEKLRGSFGEAVEYVEGIGDPFAVLKEKERLLDLCRLLRSDAELSFDFPTLVSGVDDGTTYWVVYHLFSLRLNHRFVLKVNAGKENPSVASLFSVWPGVDWHEREAFDMFGIRFEGHPNLRRILLPDDWEGYPLRKDYQFPEKYRDIPLR